MIRLYFGGSFDPIHYGHLVCARLAAEQIGAGHVCLIVAGRSPFKTGPLNDPNGTAELADGSHRFAMARLATRGDPFLSADDTESRRPGPSYTFDTVHQLGLALPGMAPSVWLIGTDQLPRLHRWHRFDELTRLVRFVVMRRAGEAIDPNTLDPRVSPMLDSVIEVPAVGISSTLVRQRVATGLPLTGFVAPAVERYIGENQLYRRSRGSMANSG
jgi:nicotinate-nucleotide adenylyltransferase